MSPARVRRKEIVSVNRVSSLARAIEHAEQVARVVRVSDHVERLAEASLRHALAHILQRREILNGESDAIEQSDLTHVPATRREPSDDAPEFGDRIAAVHLLDLAFNPSLRRIFDERIGAKQDVPVQFRLAGAVSPDRVDVNPRTNHVVRQDRGLRSQW